LKPVKVLGVPVSTSGFKPDEVYLIPTAPLVMRGGETPVEALLRQIRENPKSVALVRGLKEEA